MQVSADLTAALGDLDVVIDFSSAAAVAATADACAAAGVALLVGTTGLDARSPAAPRCRCHARFRCWCPPTPASRSTCCWNWSQRAARALPAGYDIEIFEAHHRHKVDAPSGTALVLGEAAAAGSGEQLQRPVDLTGERARRQRATGGIGFSVVRGGDVVGEHDVRFLGAGEQLRLTHVATDRAIFARGAVAAAAVAGRAAHRAATRWPIFCLKNNSLGILRSGIQSVAAGVFRGKSAWTETGLET